MGLAILKVRLMPTSPTVNLDKIKEEAEKVVTKVGGRIHAEEKEPIAFGIVALILTIAWPEEKDQDLVEQGLSKIKDVNSVQVIDFRRAFG